MRIRRIGHLFLAVVLALPLALPTVSHASNFNDVAGHWADFYISKVYDENIIKGYPNGRFHPDKAVTRAEFAAIVNKAFELDKIDVSEEISYIDVVSSSWYYHDIEIAVNAGYAGGYSDNTFKPNTSITRQEAAVMLSRLITAGKKSGNLKSYSDVSKIESWATDAFAKLNGKGYLGAYDDNRLHPADPLTRAQTAKIISDILDNEDIITGKTVVDKDGTELLNKTYVGDVLIDEDLAEGSINIDNCIIIGDLIIEGGGDGTITLNNTRVTSSTIDKNDSSVRVVAKGSTVIQKAVLNQICSLQASGKGIYAFPDITIKRAADVTLKGSFPSVTINGSKASLTLASGDIATLTVTEDGEYSDIVLSGKSSIANAIVEAECYFHGTGSISYMEVGADDVTYETKPDKMVVGLSMDRPVSEGEEEIEVTIKPSNKADDVDVDTKITVTFSTAVLLANGSAVAASSVSNFLTLHTGTLTGAAVSCTATVNSAKKVITLTPAAKLAEYTKYYIVLSDSALKNIGDYYNDAEKSYFTTGGTTPKISSYSLTAAETSITVSFKPNVAGTVYAMASTSSTVPSSADIIAAANTAAATANTAGTISLTGMTPSTKYYVYSLLKNSAGINSATVSASTTTLSTEALLSNLTLAPSGGSNLLTDFSSSVKTYSVVVPLGTTTVDVTAGTNTTANPNAVIAINSTTGTSLAGIAVTAGSTTAITITISADGKTASTYTINVTVATS